jgi:hypothetical protein
VDLEAAADVLVRKVTSFDTEADQALERFKQMTEELAAQERELDADWSAFVAGVTELVKAAREAGTGIGKATDEAVQGLGRLGAAIAEAQPQILTEASEADGELGALQERAEGMEAAVSKQVAAAENPLKELADQAKETGEAVEQTLEAGGEYLEGKFSDEMNEERSLIGQLAEASVNITNDLAKWLDQAYLAWAQKLAQAEDHAHVHGFNKVEEHAGKVAEHAQGECDTAHQNALEKLMPLLEEAHQALVALKEAVAEKGTELEGPVQRAGEVFGTLETTADAANAALDKALEAFQNGGYM